MYRVIIFFNQVFLVEISIEQLRQKIIRIIAKSSIVIKAVLYLKNNVLFQINFYIK